MLNKWIDMFEEIFYDYTKQYDENIKEIIIERNIELSIEELEEILKDAKNRVLNIRNI
ncbi:hypothetical protein [Halothermothrix orenii]|uniref:Uncharacterized protein n=1 Tax=Halothermothrix orenii (strain H 168 / OCM 544 / DSM 9562) TaxID=373903 RepID=B8CXB3_HALOH|nr:hypothetical protein [Halothermothrix orenii]ACL69932.1 hypothetical protein Hore_11820 [Halothermothrix orenii H 168]